MPPPHSQDPTPQDETLETPSPEGVTLTLAPQEDLEPMTPSRRALLRGLLRGGGALLACAVLKFYCFLEPEIFNS